MTPLQNNTTSFEDLLKTLPLHVLLPFLEDQDFRALALCCRLSREKVKKLEVELKKTNTTFRNPNRHLVLTNLLMPQEIELKALPKSKHNWNIEHIALPCNGDWLFVVHASFQKTHHEFRIDKNEHNNDYRYCIDIYRQESTSPLRYIHVKRSQLTNNQLFFSFPLGLHNERTNPGIYFRKDGSVYRFNKTDESPVFLQNCDGVVAFCGDESGHTSYSCHHYTEGRFHTPQLKMVSHRGQTQITSITDIDPHTFGNRFRFHLSPNGDRLLILGNQAVVYETQTLTPLSARLNPVESLRPQYVNFQVSITDDGYNIVTHWKIFQSAGASVAGNALDNGGHFAHSGNGRLFLRAINGKIQQDFLTRPRLNQQAASELIVLQNHLFGEGSSFYFYLDRALGHRPSSLNDFLRIIVQTDIPADTQAILCESSLRFDAPLKLGCLLQEFSDFSASRMSALLFSVDIVLLNRIHHLAINEDAYQQAKTQPRLAGLCVLAKWLREKNLQEPLSLKNLIDLFIKKNDRIDTDELGTINTRSFFWSIQANSGLFTGEARGEEMGHSKIYDDIVRILSKRKDVDFNLNDKHCLERHYLLLLSLLIEPNLRIVDLCCQSRHATWDKKHKKLIPKSFSLALREHPKLRNCLSLDALLKKLITWLPEAEVRELESARLRMNDAVGANPSLRLDPVQLLSTRFYGQRNILSNIRDPHYRDLLCEHFAAGHDFASDFEIDPEISSKGRSRCGL